MKMLIVLTTLRPEIGLSSMNFDRYVELLSANIMMAVLLFFLIVLVAFIVYYSIVIVTFYISRFIERIPEKRSVF